MNPFQTYVELRIAFFFNYYAMLELQADIFTMGFLDGMEQQSIQKQQRIAEIMQIQELLFPIVWGYTISQNHADQFKRAVVCERYEDFIQSRCSDEPPHLDLPFLNTMRQSYLRLCMGPAGDMPPWGPF